jgi:hypothetical protein
MTANGEIMEKVIYLLWRDPALSAEDHGLHLRADLAPRLKQAGAQHLTINLDDAAVRPAAGLRQQHWQPQPAALLQLWLDSASDRSRETLDRLVAAHSTRHAAYLVTESQPLRNTLHPPQAGSRTAGWSQIALLERPQTLDYAAWIDIWLNQHTKVARETQSHFQYVQNVVARTLTPQAPKLDAIVEECFPAAAMTDPHVFFDAAGDEAKFQRNLQRMMESVNRFIDMQRIEVVPTSQYCLY